MPTLILVVDPSPDTRAIYTDYFTHHGYLVAQAAHAVEAAQLTRMLHPAVIVTELCEDGEWVHVIRCGDSGREAAIIACTTLVDASAPRLPFACDVDSVIPKPASLRTLLGEVERLVARHAPVPQRNAALTC